MSSIDTPPSESNETKLCRTPEASMPSRPYLPPV